MDAITQAFQSLGPILKDASGVAQAGSTAYNLYNQYQNQQYQNQLRSYAQDPAKMNAYAAKFTQPLTAGLTTGVANQAQADLATRGLSDSPEISQQVYAQAIAPYIQQNQQQGYQNALQALQVGGGAVNPNLQSTNSINSLAKIFSQLPGASPSGNAGLQLNSTLTNPVDQAPGGVLPDQDPINYTPDYAGFGNELSYSG